MVKFLHINIFLIVFITFSFSDYLYSQTIEDEKLISNPQKGIVESAPYMQMGNDGTIYISWIRFKSQANGDIYFTTSEDNGDTFSSPIMITENGSVNGNFQRGARFVVDKNRTIHVVWMESKVNDQTDIWYSKSTDKGLSWNPQKVVTDSDDSSKYTQDFCDIAVDSNNKLYVSFLDARFQQRKISGNLQLYLTTSTDNGETWSENRKVNEMPLNEGGTCECCSQSIEVSPEGNIYIAFRTNIKNRRDIFLARSLDKGMTFETAFPIQNNVWTINACPVTGPKIALDKNENLHCVWFDDRDDELPAVYYALIPYGSTDTPENKHLSQNSFTGINYPDVSVTNDGNVAIVYQTFNQNARFYFGENPLQDYSDMPISSFNSEKKFVNVIAKDKNLVYACWQDSRNDAGDIYFKIMWFNTSEVFENFIISNEAKNLQNLFPDGKIEIKIFDLLGNLIYQNQLESIEIENEKSIFNNLKNDIPSSLYVVNFSNMKDSFSRLVTFVK